MIYVTYTFVSWKERCILIDRDMQLETSIRDFIWALQIETDLHRINGFAVS